MRLCVGANSRGYQALQQITGLLIHNGHDVDAVQSPEAGGAEYPEIAAAVARSVQSGVADSGVLIGGTGMGMCIVANKFRGIRACVCDDEVMVETCRRYLDANVLCISADLVSADIVERMIQRWMATPFDGGRHARRKERIAAIEQENSSRPTWTSGTSDGLDLPVLVRG